MLTLAGMKLDQVPVLILDSWTGVYKVPFWEGVKVYQVCWGKNIKLLREGREYNDCGEENDMEKMERGSNIIYK